jgi:hypothetical protein
MYCARAEELAQTPPRHLVVDCHQKMMSNCIPYRKKEKTFKNAQPSGATTSRPCGTSGLSWIVKRSAFFSANILAQANFPSRKVGMGYQDKSRVKAPNEATIASTLIKGLYRQYQNSLCTAT